MKICGMIANAIISGAKPYPSRDPHRGNRRGGGRVADVDLDLATARVARTFRAYRPKSGYDRILKKRNQKARRRFSPATGF